MNKYFTTFDVIDDNKGYKYWTLLSLLVLTFLLLLLFLFVIEITFWKNLFLTLFLLQLFISIFSKEKIIGRIVFSENDILLRINEQEQFSIAELTYIKISYGGAEGTIYNNPKAIGLKDGTTNYIKFQTQTQFYQYRFKVQLNQISTFKKIISIWKSKNQKFIFVGDIETI